MAYTTTLPLCNSNNQEDNKGQNEISKTQETNNMVHVVFFLLGDSTVSEFCVLMFWNIPSVPSFTTYEDSTDRAFQNIGT